MLAAVIACALLTTAFIPAEAVGLSDAVGTSVLSHSEGPQVVPGVEAPGPGADASAAQQAAPASDVKQAPTVAEATITVNQKQWGVSTRYIGGTEGSSR